MPGQLVLSNHDYLMEALIASYGLHFASAERVTLVMPDFFYERSDKKTKPHEPITAKLVADMIKTAKADRVLLIDLHKSQIQGFFDIPTDHLRACDTLCKHLRRRDLSNSVIVAADAGGAENAGRYAKRLFRPLVVIDKRRVKTDKVEARGGVLGDVSGKEAIIVDDQIASASTAEEAAKALQKDGARRIVLVATHGIFSGRAMERLDRAPIDEVIVTDTIPLPPPEQRSKKITEVSIARLIAEAIAHIHDGRPIGQSKLY